MIEQRTAYDIEYGLVGSEIYIRDRYTPPVAPNLNPTWTQATYDPPASSPPNRFNAIAALAVQANALIDVEAITGYHTPSDTNPEPAYCESRGDYLPVIRILRDRRST